MLTRRIFESNIEGNTGNIWQQEQGETIWREGQTWTMYRKKIFHEDILLGEKKERDFGMKVREADYYTKEGLDNLIGANVTL